MMKRNDRGEPFQDCVLGVKCPLFERFVRIENDIAWIKRFFIAIQAEFLVTMFIVVLVM